MDDVQSIAPREVQGSTRRTFYIGAIYGLWSLITAALSLPAFIYLFFPPKARRESEWVEVGDIGKLAQNTPTEMVFRRTRVDGWKISSEKSTAWVVKSANQVVAFGPQCTHLGCAYHWDDSKSEFLCPCHSSLFAMDGKVISGPAPRPLDRYQTKVEGKKLLIGHLNSPGDKSA
jgi:menaquinol-cytochrome c reductase iron-sulfur subunit